MTSTDHNKRARAYMDEHRVGYTEALRATTPTYAWANGTTPWLRAADITFSCY